MVLYDRFSLAISLPQFPDRLLLGVKGNAVIVNSSDIYCVQMLEMCWLEKIYNITQNITYEQKIK